RDRPSSRAEDGGPCRTIDAPDDTRIEFNGGAGASPKRGRRAAAAPSRREERSMRRVPAVVVLWSLVAGAGAARAAEPVFPFPIRQSTLENGLAVISVPFDSPGIIAYYTVVRTGSRNEVEKGLSGFAHFFEHMMFRGTEA